MIRIPKGFGKLLGDPNYAWHFPTERFGAAGTSESWTRGKTLGGSSAINGLVYNRGHEKDWNDLLKHGNDAWGWDRILASYKEIEGHELGASEMRGANGPVKVAPVKNPDPLCHSMIDAGASIGLSAVDDLNASDKERIGLTIANIHGGQRISSAHAFLHPVSSRTNLVVETGVLVTKVIFEGDRAVGVEGRKGSQSVDYRTGATGEVILSLGGLGTPKLLQLSGVGPSEILRAAGIETRIDHARIGEGMREHRCFPITARLKENLGNNKRLATPLAQAITGARYLLTKRGPLAGPSYDVIGFLKTSPDRERVDAQILLAPLSVGSHEPGANPTIEREPGIQGIAYVLRPTSEGTIHVTSADPAVSARIVPNYLATGYDRETGLAAFRRLRALFESEPLATLIDHEIDPGANRQSDTEILENASESGYCGYHAVGTCAMGSAEGNPVDASLRVRGTTGLRVMDCSVLPTMVAGNLNGPMMAMANVAAAQILADRR
jgi:choline dehydrogenase-like flavoprotein